MRRLDQYLSQQFVARLDQAAGRGFAGTGVVPRTHRTKVRKLLAGVESIETTDQRPQGDRRNDADTGLFEELFNHGIVNDKRFHFIGDPADFFVEKVNGVVMVADQKENDV